MHQCGARFAVADEQMECVARHAGLVQMAHGLGGDQRRLLGGFGQHHVAGGQRGGDLASEDGEREIPRADADHGAERHVGGVVELRGGLRGVEAQKVDRLAHLGDGVGVGLAGFAHQQAHQARHVGLQCVGGALQGGGALLRRRVGPGGGEGGRVLQRPIHVGGAGVLHVADDVAAVGGVGDGDSPLTPAFSRAREKGFFGQIGLQRLSIKRGQQRF